MTKGRIITVQKNLEKNKIGALLITNPYNIFYLTGFKTLSPEEREAFLFITKKSSVIITDRRYKPDFKNVLYISPEHRLTQYLEEITKKEKVKKIGIEGNNLTVSEDQALSKKLSELSIVSTKGIVQGLREIKNNEELQNIRHACKLTDQCLSEISKTIRIGQKEKEIAFRIEFWIKKKGLRLSFYPIVAINANSAIPHYDSREENGVVKKNSLVLIDMGIRYRNYCSDITRMFIVGNPTTRQINVYEKLLEAQIKTIEQAKKARTTKEIDIFCRDLIEKKGLKNFLHSTGHGVGLEVHEAPHISLKSEEKVKLDQVFTVEPGVYYEGEFGIRIEDMVAVKKNNVEILTKFPKTLKEIQL